MELLLILVLLVAGTLLGARGPAGSGVLSGGPARSEQWSSPVASLYVALVNVRNAELQAHWARYNIQSALNLGFVVAVFAASSSNPDSFVAQHKVYFAAAGLLLAAVWLWFTVESKVVLTNRWDRHIRQFEQMHKAALPYDLFTRVADEEKNRWFGAMTLVQRLFPIVFIVAWVVYLRTLM